jgi:2-keto-4-pentenoate hydratase
VPVDGTAQDDHVSVIAAAAGRLIEAAATGTPCAPVRDLIGRSDVPLAYAVQKRVGDHRVDAGQHVVGRKIGLTAAAVQQQVGVDQPDFGVLFADMQVPNGGELPAERLIQPRAEAEIAFILGTDLAGADLDDEQIRRAVDYAVAAVEIVDSRIRDWDITITDTVADNASSGLFVLGDRKTRLADFEPADVRMSMTKNGAVASHGAGADCLGSPLAALKWLASTARDFGAPLRAGDVILSGALGGLVPLEPGAVLAAEFSALGRVDVTAGR